MPVTRSITKEEYDERLAQIEGIEKEAYDLYQKFLKKKARRRQDVFDELDKETSRSKSLKKAYDRISGKIDSFAIEDQTPAQIEK